MSNKPTSEGIAKAMRDAAWIATHGTREERSGRFMATKPSSSCEAAAPNTRAASAEAFFKPQ